MGGPRTMGGWEGEVGHGGNGGLPGEDGAGAGVRHPGQGYG
jgi:hypothetical protein